MMVMKSLQNILRTYTQNGNGRNSCSLTNESGENTLSGIALFSESQKKCFSGTEKGAVLKFLHKYPGLSYSFYSLYF